MCSIRCVRRDVIQHKQSASIFSTAICLQQGAIRQREKPPKSSRRNLDRIACVVGAYQLFDDVNTQFEIAHNFSSKITWLPMFWSFPTVKRSTSYLFLKTEGSNNRTATCHSKLYHACYMFLSSLCHFTTLYSFLMIKSHSSV